MKTHITTDSGLVIDLKTVDENWFILFELCGKAGLSQDGEVYASDGVWFSPAPDEGAIDHKERLERIKALSL